MNETISNKKLFSQIGLRLFIGTLIIFAVQLIFGAIAGNIPAVATSGDLSLLVSMLPMYIIAFPIIFLLFKNIPVQISGEKKKMSVKHLIVAFIMCYAGTYICNLLASILTGIIGALKQSDVENVMANLLSIDWNSTISQVVGALTSGFTNIVGVVVGVVSSVVGGFFTAFLSIMFSVYLLISKETLGRQGKKAISKLIKPAHYNKFEYVSGIVNKTFRGYIIGQCTEALILGVLCGLGMWILRMPYAAMISALVAFTSLVPIAGPYVGGAIAAFMIFTVSPIQAVIFVVYLVILQQIEGNLIYPKVVGTSVGLPAIWVLVAITIGGGIAGIAGMLLGVPVAAVIYKLIKDKWAEEPAAE